MTNKNALHDLLHEATHHIPGVPTHAERATGHQGRTPRGRTHRPSANHSSARPPRFMPAWQRRIAAFFGREL